MSKKAAILRHLNMRAIKAGFYSTICRLPALRDYLNYYQDAVYFADAADERSVKMLEIDPVNDYDVEFSESEIQDILRCKDVSSETLKLRYKMARLSDGICVVLTQNLPLVPKLMAHCSISPSGRFAA